MKVPIAGSVRALAPRNLYDLTDRLVSLLIVLIPFHAFLTVVGSSLLGHYTLLRLWDEALLLFLLTITGIILFKDHRLRKTVFGNVLFKLILVYCLLTLIWGVVALVKGNVDPKALGYGLIVNLRFLLWFLVIAIVRVKAKGLEKLIIIPLIIVVCFALLQFFVLPHKFLAHFGYDSLVNVAPETTINKTSNIIRAQSFLRGPNPLGAYLLMCMGIILAIISRRRKLQVALLFTVIVAMAVTFSRSAWIGAFVAAAIVIGLRLKTSKARIIAAFTMVALALAVGGIFLLFRHDHSVQSAFLHVHDGSSQIETSNEGHASAFRDGVGDVLSEPLGRGPGTAGPASLYNAGHEERNSESYFLQIGQELGWIGLTLFIAINVAIGVGLWRNRSNPLALGLLATLVGLTIVNQLSYAWADDTLAYLWWGLAGAILIFRSEGDDRKEQDIKS